MSKNEDISKLLSLVLRHKPETIGIELDKNGWADVSELLSKIGRNISMDLLEEIVATSDKKRFAFNDAKTKIRANQGHSINVDVELKVVTPPKILYHGTADRFLESIMAKGLEKGNRLHVHLSENYDTATKVGIRHGKPLILKIDAEKMNNDGYKFYLSANNVWLTDFVPVKYISCEFDV